MAPALAVLDMESLDVFDAEPHPRPRLSLSTFRQVDAGPVPYHAREVVSTPLGIAETEDIDVVAQAARHAGDIQDWMGVFELRSRGFCFRHVILEDDYDHVVVASFESDLKHVAVECRTVRDRTLRTSIGRRRPRP